MLRELALFAGAGGGILGGHLLGWRTVCAVELDAYAARVLVSRQNDGHLPAFPIWDDVRTFDGLPWRGIVDVVSGGFPCQDISCAGKGGGIDGARSGLWLEMARIVREVQPRFVFVENSPALASRGLGVVLGDLAALGYDAQWGVLGAHHAGAPHKRDRIWIVADASRRRRPPARGGEMELERRAETFGASALPNAGRAALRNNEQREAGRRLDVPHRGQAEPGNGGAKKPLAGWRAPQWWAAEPGVGRVVNGMAHRMDRLKALGNGQVPSVAALAWHELQRRGSE